MMEKLDLKDGGYYKPGMIIELRPGQIEEGLLSKYKYFSKIQSWDYRKPFDFSEWIKQHPPIVFDEDGQYKLKYEQGDRILIGPWLKGKTVELFAERKTNWHNRGQIINNCQEMLYLKEEGFIKSTPKNIDGNLSNGNESHQELLHQIASKDTTRAMSSSSKKLSFSHALRKLFTKKEDNNEQQANTEEELIDLVLKNWTFGGAEDREIYPLIYGDFWKEAEIFSGTEELYKCRYDEQFYAPYYKNEVWDINQNRELLLAILNQSFFEMLVLHSKEVLGPEKDELFEEEFRNRIKILSDYRYVDQIFYQAIDDEIATAKLLELQKNGFDIIFDPYNPNNSYPSGNIKYFYCCHSWTENEKSKDTVAQFADELTDVEARRIFPEEFYLGRAYYQVKPRCSDTKYT